MRRKHNDIVLSMTLAETFLLLLFLIWLGDVARTSSGGAAADPTIMRLENARLKAENERLAAESRRLAEELRKQQLIVEAFRKALGLPEPITSPEQVEPAVKSAQEAARRGAPKCATTNVFARVAIRDGSTTVSVVAADSVARQVEAKTGLAIPVGAVLTQDADIEEVLRAVSEYAEANSCRFDYTLSYETKSDYFDARERFEKGRLFYLAGISSATKAIR